MSENISLKVACYTRAMTLHVKLARPWDVETLADKIVEFVNGEPSRLEAFDAVMSQVNRRNTIEVCLAQTQAIIDWADPPKAKLTPPPVRPGMLRKKTTTHRR